MFASSDGGFCEFFMLVWRAGYNSSSILRHVGGDLHLFSLKDLIKGQNCALLMVERFGLRRKPFFMVAIRVFRGPESLYNQGCRLGEHTSTPDSDR